MSGQVPSDGEWRVGVERIRDLSVVEPLWRDLQTRSDHSFFQSWGWIGSWLKTFPDSADVLLLQAHCGDQLVGLSVLGRNTVTSNRVFTARALLVSEAGDPNHDALTVEHSGLLVQRGLEREVIGRSLRYLHSIEWQWDELYVSGVELGQADIYLQAARAAGLSPVVRARHPYFYVDCDGLRRAGSDYLGSLSANTRYQIRRSMRLYEQQWGPLGMQVATSVEQGLEFFDTLRIIHQDWWQRRGRPGAFATEAITRFHRSLIAECLDRGEVQLARVSAGEHDFGYLYNFVMDGVVSNYQTGFRYQDDARLKPGLVSHALAIEHNLQAGCAVYDFLMGDQRFKRSLAKTEASMLWLVLRRGGWHERLASGLRGMLRLLTGRPA